MHFVASTLLQKVRTDLILKHHDLLINAEGRIDLCLDRVQPFNLGFHNTEDQLVSEPSLNTGRRRYYWLVALVTPRFWPAQKWVRLWLIHVSEEIAEPTLNNLSAVAASVAIPSLEYHPTVLSERSVNHSSHKSSLAVGLSLGSSFMIFSTNTSSTLQISLSPTHWNGLSFSGGSVDMMPIIASYIIVGDLPVRDRERPEPLMLTHDNFLVVHFMAFWFVWLEYVEVETLYEIDELYKY
jgi:hypothetical protein